ncbi:J domain-containing protein [Phenylobacterium sp.]|uniref:J domain-containing protein n=1 Tax=Phenylobacterium sp. TaxID=1871053 RepID=UPI002FD8AF68
MSGAETAMSVREARKALGVGAQATPGELRRAFRQAAKSVHPDRPGGDAEAFRRLVAAYDLLRTAAAAPRKFIQPPAPRPPSRAAQGSVGDPHTLSVPPLVAFAGGAVEHRLSDGRKLRISCPPGLRAGDRLRAGGEVLTVAVRGDGALIVRGDDVWLTVRLDPALLSQGGRIQVETPLGPRDIWITRKALERGLVRLEGGGLPARGRRREGDLFIRLEPAGEAASSAARTLLRRFAAAWAA